METFKAPHIFIELTLSEKLLAALKASALHRSQHSVNHTLLLYSKHGDTEESCSIDDRLVLAMYSKKKN